MRLRQSHKVPHHVYRQHGPLPDRRPWPQGDDPVAFFTDPTLAEFVVEAANEKMDRLEQEGASS